jgi:hypothetical protein
MRIRHQGDRVIVERANFSGWQGTVPPSMTGGADRIVDAIPTLVLSRDGTFLGIEGSQVARDRFLASVKAAGPFNRQEWPVLESVTSDPGLTAIAQDHWSVLVAFWRDFEAGTDQPVAFRSRTPVPQLGGGEVDILGEAVSTAIVPCARGGLQRQCAVLRLTTVPDRQQVTSILERLLRYRAERDPKMVVWDQRFEATIVTEVDTLLPHRVTVSRRAEMQLVPPGSDQRVTGSEHSTKDYSFRY